MSLQELEPLAEGRGLSATAESFLVEAQGRIDEFTARRREDPVPGFVPCDFHAVGVALKAIATEKLAPGPRFCEWGAGFGVAACLASVLGFEAYGIEIDDELVEEARSLASDFGLDVEFASGSFIPREGEELTDVLADSAWLAMGGKDAHEELGLDPEDFDLVFAFPWPGDERAILDLFDRFGATGSILLLYLGVEGIRSYRKTG